MLSSIMFFACETNSNKVEDEAEVANADESELDDIFQLTTEDLREDQVELEKKLTVIKNSGQKLKL